MKPRALAATWPKCDKSSNLTLVDCVVLARAFEFLAKTASGSNEDAVGKFLDNFPAMRGYARAEPSVGEGLGFNEHETSQW